MNKQKSIFLIGPSGAGKSTMGLELAKALKFDFFDSDQVIEKRSGVSISWIYDVEGEKGFRQRETKVINELVSLPTIVLATGGGAILKSENREILKAHGFIIYLKTNIAHQLKRIQRKDHRPLLQVEDVESRLNEMYEKRTPLYEDMADVTFDTDQQSVKSITKKVLIYLRECGY